MDEAVALGDRVVALVWADVVLGEFFTDLAVPGAATDQLWVEGIVTNDVHVIPPSVVEVLPELLVHAHVQEAVDWEVQGVGRTDHLSVVDETEVGGGHGVVVLVALICHMDQLTSPLVRSEVILDPSLSVGALVGTNDGREVVRKWKGLWRE